MATKPEETPDDLNFEDDDISAIIGSAADATEDNGLNKGKGQQENIAKTETRVVLFVKILVCFLLFAVTAGVAVGVFFYVSNQEENEFEDDYSDSSDKAFDAIRSVLDRSLGASHNLMANAVSHQKYSNSSWPFVTLPDFSVKAQNLLALSRASITGVYPKVLDEEREDWEAYALENQEWIDQSLKIQRESSLFHGKNVDIYEDFPHVTDYNGVISSVRPMYYPAWQQSPIVPDGIPWGRDLYSYAGKDLDEVERSRVVVMGRTRNTPSDEGLTAYMADRVGTNETDTDPAGPFFTFYYPIVGNATTDVNMTSLDPERHEIVGVIASTVYWEKVFENLLAPGSRGIIAVIGGECDASFTFQIDGPNPTFIGVGDLHDTDYDEYGRFSYMANLGIRALRERQYAGFPLSDTYCPYWIHLYPSNSMKAVHESNDPIIFTVVTVCVFLFTAMFFIIYDCVSERRQKKVLHVAMQSTALVSNLFPQVVRDRIFPTEKIPRERISTAKLRLQQFLRNDGDGNGNDESGNEQRGTSDTENLPIAELFSETTVMFADIVGFTAWSSVREPTQVFTLLETLYGAFDKLAARRGVFKVETIGDSYVAVVGLPEPRPDHAVVMAKFARDIREKLGELVKKLGNTLGPDTADLECRIGLNSGPVTAGVLRGERSRFQLFGDTVNTAARMESNGKPSKIHISQSTTDLLFKAGKGHWITKRDGEIVAKGKGQIQTYWVEPVSRALSSSSGNDDVGNMNIETMDEKTRRLVDWNVEVLSKLLKQIISRRQTRVQLGKKAPQKPTNEGDRATKGSTVLEEVKEVIMLPEYDPYVVKASRNQKPVELSDGVINQLREFVSLIATMYPNNPFHNFEHASHVTMSVVKLLSRIIAPTDLLIKATEVSKGVLDATLHDHTYGITSDPLTQFACVFSALIHDVEHPGIPNSQLIKEGSPLDEKYKGKSLAEQNSVDISWKLLMEDQFEDLRKLICNDDTEMARFRQLVVNGVMATDIMDKDLKNLRNQRWDKAFSDGARLGESHTVNTNRKATIVIEHLIQASDVSHTMQHWHIFRKWNERLFAEMYTAYKAGRAEKNPAEFWYKGEMGFFDFYIIPLVKKLHDCGVFGVSSDEYLSYALKNREEWENRGQEELAAMIVKYDVSLEGLPQDVLSAVEEAKSDNVSRDDKPKEQAKVEVERKQEDQNIKIDPVQPEVSNSGAVDIAPLPAKEKELLAV